MIFDQVIKIMQNSIEDHDLLSLNEDLPMSGQLIKSSNLSKFKFFTNTFEINKIALL
jgi:hypothetical protein